MGGREKDAPASAVWGQPVGRMLATRLLAQGVQQQLWCGSSCDAGDRGMDAFRRSVGVACSETPTAQFLHQCLAQLSFHEATRSCQAAMRRFCNRPLGGGNFCHENAMKYGISQRRYCLSHQKDLTELLPPGLVMESLQLHSKWTPHNCVAPGWDTLGCSTVRET